jgi:hypothetical protein
MEHKKTNKKLVTGVFKDRKGVEDAFGTLHKRGYTKDDIHLVMSDETRKKHFTIGKTETKSFNF